MTINRSQAIEHVQEIHETGEVHGSYYTDITLENYSSTNTQMSPSSETEPSPGPNYHTAFMQCRACCNCNSQCSYHSKGHFDPQGNYVGP